MPAYNVSVAGVEAKLTLNLEKKITKIELSFQSFKGLEASSELTDFMTRCYEAPMTEDSFSRLYLEGLTPFQTSVYKALVQVKKGQRLSYKQLAENIGNPRACRAVGHAMALNPFPLIVPCHRVILSNGSCGQFAFGSAMKEQLLAFEN